MTALWSAVARRRFCNHRHVSHYLIFALADPSRKRRQTAVRQNVGMPTFKVLLEGGSWYETCRGLSEQPSFRPPRRDAITEVGA
jgi:hypothetical protein